MNIVQEKTSELTANLKIQLEAPDYQEKVEKAFRDLQKKASIKGFRPGKVPMGMVKKMYGKGILVEEVNKILNDALYNYIKENNLNILGNPLPDDINQPEIDWDNQQDFEFVYNIGLAPDIHLDFNDKIDVVYHKIKIEDTILEETITDIRKRNGAFSTPETSLGEDVLFGNFEELDGDGKVFENGLQSKTNVYIKYMKDEETRNSLIDKKIGDSVVIDLVKSVENETEMASLLNIKKEELEQYGKNYLFTIERISRVELAGLNEELYKKVSPEKEIKDEQEFRAFVAEQIQKQYQNDVDKNFKNEAITVILDKLNLELPEEFLKRWLIESNADNTEVNPEQVEKEFVSLKEAFKWQLVENHIIKEHKIEVKHEEVTEYLKNYMRMQLRQYGQEETPDEVLNDFVKRIASKQEELKKVYDQLFDVKVLNLLKEKLNLQEKETSFDDFVAEMTEKYKNKNSNQS